MLGKSPDYVCINEIAAGLPRLRHEDMDMSNMQSEKRFARWFPGQTQARDRWGDPIANEIGGREFHGSSAVAGAAERMRWSLGLA